MSILERYQAYADAFEESYEDDDWSRLGLYFTDDAVYEPDAKGRDAVLAKLKDGVDAFDRRMDSRAPDFQTPTVEGNSLTMRWTVTYTKAGAPALVLKGVETAILPRRLCGPRGRHARPRARRQARHAPRRRAAGGRPHPRAPPAL